MADEVFEFEKLSENEKVQQINSSYTEKYGFHARDDNYTFKSRKGLDREVVLDISRIKGEPEWMTERRLEALEIFQKKPMPQWGGGGTLNQINFDDIYYYMKASDKEARSWDDVPDDIKYTFDRLGIPEAEQKFLAGAAAQYESEVVYHNIKKDLEEKGVIFLSTDQALKEYPEYFDQYFGTVIPASDNKFAALNSAVWSGGSFIYVPKGVKVDMPLQAYFRINAQNMGQFERTLIICDEGSWVHYVEGCTAPTWSSESLHSAVVEILVKKGARCRYTTIQNWAPNVYNLVTKRAVCEEGATMEWVDGNIGCLAEGSTVTTALGIQPIESLRIGDQVLSYDEQSEQLVWREVVAKRFSGYQPVLNVSVGERQLRVTANHPFYSYTYNPKLGRYQLAYVRADHLKEAIIPRTSIEYGTPYRLQKPSLVTEFQSMNQYASDMTMNRSRESRLTNVEETTDDIMWWLGCWTGDGNIEIAEGKTEGVIRWAKVGRIAPENDRASVRMDVMTGLIEPSHTVRADKHHLAWNSKELAELLMLNGFGGKALDKRIPEWVWSLPESQRLAFIGGFLDADGTVVPSTGCFSLKSANRQLLASAANLLVTLGITSRLYAEFSTPRTVTILGYECTAQGSYRLTFPLDERLFPYISPHLHEQAEDSEPVKRKYKRNLGLSQRELPESVEIVKVAVSEASEETVPTWDIEVAGTGNFVSQGFIVHNSKLTMKYPAVYMIGPHARGEILSIAFAGKGQHQDAGAKAIHAAPHTSSIITSKSISKDGGRAGYRGLVQVLEGAHDSKSNVLCDALILDEHSRSDTYPYIDIREDNVSIGHEATVSKVGEEQLFYLMSRGIGEEEAMGMIVAGFIEPIVKELPMEYAVEMNRLIQLEMEGSVG